MELRNALRPHELRIVSAVLQIEPRRFEDSRTSVEIDETFVRAQYRSVEDRHCPFEFHFGRGENENRLNFFVGVGAELFNYESVDPALGEDFSVEIERFLRSHVRCDMRVTEKGIARATYMPDKLVVEGLQIRLEYKNYAWPFFRYKKASKEYLPWID